VSRPAKIRAEFLRPARKFLVGNQTANSGKISCIIR
jgi:hypothetical protein